MIHLKIRLELFFVFSLILFSFSTKAQNDFDFKPGMSQHTHQQEIVNRIQAKYIFDRDHTPKKLKKQVDRHLQERKNGVIQRLSSGYYLFDSVIDPKIQNIFTKILQANPQLPKDDLRIFVTRYSYPNASSIGEGSLEFNLGLLKHLKNESQIAFIIAHEIAHYYLDHSNQAILSHYNYLETDEASQELKKIKKTKYGKETKKEAFYKDLVFDHRRHSRYNESAADSFAIVFLQNTDYSLEESLTALSILEQVDDRIKIDSFDLRAIFSVDGIEFNDSWVELENTDFLYQELATWDKDSLKTHPDIEKRILKLGEDFNLKIPEEYIDNNIAHLVKLSEYEIIEGAIELGNYATAIYSSIILLDKYPKDAYLISAIGQNLLWIYQARKEHVFSDHVPLPDPNFPYNYNLVLNFIHNLRYNETKNLGIQYLEAHNNSNVENEEFLFTLAMAAYYSEEEKKFKNRVGDYHEKFPDGKYEKHLNDLVID